MKVKTFTGTHRFAVDGQVNDWLAKSNVTVRKTNVAFKAIRDRGWDAVSGKATTRRAVAIAITVWYDEPLQSNAKTKTGHLDFQIGPIAAAINAKTELSVQTGGGSRSI